MMRLSHPSILLIFVFLLSVAVVVVDANNLAAAWKQVRRMANLGNLFGSARITAATPYERVGNHPVFQVTTSWGAPYMSFEKVDEAFSGEAAAGQNLLGYGGDMRPVTLYYMDPEDALQMHQEMKQMQNMAKSDIRITATTLSKAIRQSANFGDGLPTGAPVDPLTGKLASIQDGGSLRYKIVPSKRQLFYAARCQGRERVGLFGENPAEDAAVCLDGLAALDAANQGRRRNVLNGKSRAATPQQRKYRHMEGYSGIPVFYCPALRKKLPAIKGILGGTAEENPLFFSYEDLVEAWNKMRKTNKNAPTQPPNVEVMNLMDVLTSMDREKWSEKHSYRLQLKDPMASLTGQMGRMTNAINKRFSGPGLDAINFIPAGNAVEYKNDLASRGNGKSRLRPMRQWGMRA